VNGKLERGEIERLKTYIDKKLKELNKKISQNMAVLNPSDSPNNAAGKKKRLGPYSCLSCDKPVTAE